MIHKQNIFNLTLDKDEPNIGVFKSSFDRVLLNIK